MDSQTSPSDEDQEWLDQVSRGYVGLEKPKVAHTTEPNDPHSWKRRKAAERLGVNEQQLNDEPDNDAGSGEQAFA